MVKVGDGIKWRDLDKIFIIDRIVGNDIYFKYYPSLQYPIECICEGIEEGRLEYYPNYYNPEGFNFRLITKFNFC
jgi:hypothetical protein